MERKINHNWAFCLANFILQHINRHTNPPIYIMIPHFSSLEKSETFPCVIFFFVGMLLLKEGS